MSSYTHADDNSSKLWAGKIIELGGTASHATPWIRGCTWRPCAVPTVLVHKLYRASFANKIIVLNEQNETNMNFTQKKYYKEELGSCHF